MNGSPDPRARWTDFLLVALAALAIQAAFMASLPPEWRQSQSVDYAAYYAPLARNLLAGSGWKAPRESIAFAYPPGYTAVVVGLLAASRATGLPEMSTHAAFNALCQVLTTLLIFLIALRAFGRRAAWCAALVWMTYPFPLWLSREPNLEQPFVVVFFGITCLLLTATSLPQPPRARVFAVGALVGAASLLRPFAIALSAPAALILWISPGPWPARKRLLLAGLLILGNLAAVLPWEIWVYSRIGQVIPLCINGPSSILDGLEIDVGPNAPPGILPVPQDVRLWIQDLEPHNREFQSLRAIARYLFHEFLSRPVTLLKLLGLKALRALYATDSQRFEPLVAALQAPYYLLALLGARIAWRRGQTGRSFLKATLLFLLYFWGMAVVVLSIVRYLIPAMGLLIVLVGLTVSRLADQTGILRRKLPTPIPS